MLTTSGGPVRPRLSLGLVAGLVTATLIAVTATEGQAAPSPSNPSAETVKQAHSARDFFPVPEAALVRPMGDIAPNLGTPFPVPYAGTPGLGIPLGGVGAGSFMVNQSGTFGPWSFNGSQGSS